MLGAYEANRTPLTELHLDDCRFRMYNAHAGHFSDMVEEEHRDWYMFFFYSRVERLSIKNATWHCMEQPTEHWPVPQEMLIKMVRRHPTLRWLRSDLTSDNIAMLKQERTEITFVSE